MILKLLILMSLLNNYENFLILLIVRFSKSKLMIRYSARDITIQEFSKMKILISTEYVVNIKSQVNERKHQLQWFTGVQASNAAGRTFGLKLSSNIMRLRTEDDYPVISVKSSDLIFGSNFYLWIHLIFYIEKHNTIIICKKVLIICQCSKFYCKCCWSICRHIMPDSIHLNEKSHNFIFCWHGESIRIVKFNLSMTTMFIYVPLYLSKFQRSKQ